MRLVEMNEISFIADFKCTGGLKSKPRVRMSGEDREPDCVAQSPEALTDCDP